MERQDDKCPNIINAEIHSILDRVGIQVNVSFTNNFAYPKRMQRHTNWVIPSSTMVKLGIFATAPLIGIVLSGTPSNLKSAGHASAG